MVKASEFENFNFEIKNSENEYFTEVSRTIKTTLGPSGMEKFLKKKNRGKYNY